MEWDTGRAPSTYSTYSTYSLSSIPSKAGTDYSYYVVPPENAPILPRAAVEGPKAPLRRLFNPFAHVIHLLALGASGAVLQLSFRNVYWSDEAAWDRKWFLLGLGQTDSLNALQFVAKVHEILVVASLSSIMVHIARRMLVGEKGIPFGLLMGAYQAGSPDYLFSGSFGHPFIDSLRSLKWRNFFLALALGLAIVYANMVGPASAIAIIPNLDWWPVSNPYSDRPLQSYIGLSFNESYPTVVSADSHTDTYLKKCGVTRPSIQCPGGGYESLLEWAFAWSEEGIVYDIPMSSSLVRATRDVAFRFARVSSSSSGVVFATTIKSSAAMLADLFWQYVSTNDVGIASSVQRPQFTSSDNSKLYAPFVQVQCDVFDFESARQSGGGIAFSTNLLSNFTVSSSNAYNKGNTWEVPRELWDFDRSGRALNFTWIDASQLKTRDGSTVYASIGALATVPSLWVTTWPNGTQVLEQKSTLVPCMVDARWAAAQVTYDPKNSFAVKHNLSDLSVFVDPATRDSDGRGQLGLSDTISIDTRWADLLNGAKPGFSAAEAEYNVSEYRSLTTMENFFFQFVVPSYDADRNEFFGFAPPQNVTNEEFYANVSSIVGGIISLVVADGLARESHGSSLMELKPEHDGNVTLVNLQYLAGGEKMEPFEWFASGLEDFVPVSFEVQRWGWGYGLQTQTVLFAIAVLLFHAAICVCYFIGTFSFWVQKRGWTSRSWRDFGELVALALVSREPDEFRNTGAGIKNAKTWNTTINIRERDDSGLEMVANHRGGTLAANQGLLKVRKKYGS